MFRIKTFLYLIPVAAFGQLLNPSIDSSLFNVTTFTTNVINPEGMVQLPDGSIAVETSPEYDSAPGQLLRFVDANGVATGAPILLYTSVNPGLMIQIVQLGKYYAIGNFGDDTITLLQPGQMPTDPWTSVAVIQFSFPAGWEHTNAGLAARPTPGQPGSYDLVMNVGSEFDNTASVDPVGLSATGFSSFPAGLITADSLYVITIDETGVQPSASNLMPVATGIRNSFGMKFQPGTGDFYFADNGEDEPADVYGYPSQADELNYISAADFGNGSPPNFGFPDCFTQYITNIQIGSGCTQPIAVFQPIPDTPSGKRTQGPTEIAFSPPNFPAPYDNGVFVAFTGDGGGPGDPSAGLVFYNLNTKQYFQFIQSGNPSIADLWGLLATSDALYVSDAGTGVYKITAAPVPGQVLITIGSNISGPEFQLEDGTTYQSPATFAWTLGAQHTVTWLPLAASQNGARYVFENWLDGSASNPRTIVVPNANANYTATLQLQYQMLISASPGAAGTVSPASGYYAAGSTVPISAVPVAGYQFSSWTGSVASSTSASTTVTLSGPESVVANFVPSTQSVTIETSPPGLQVSVDGGPPQIAPQTLSVSQGPHTIAVTTPQAGSAGTQYVFTGWSDSGAASHSITVGTSPATYTASFKTQYELTLAASPAGVGTVTPVSGAFYDSGSVVPVTATANSGYVFAGWTGNVANSGSSSTTVTMNAAEVLAANFSPNPMGHPSFFNGETALGNGIYYLQFPDSNVFGYYSYLSSTIIYHADMGYEGIVDAPPGAVYMYDFLSGHWFYTSSTLFPYLYDFTLQAWIYYFPDIKNAGHYTTNPRSFANLDTGMIFNM